MSRQALRNINRGRKAVAESRLPQVIEGLAAGKTYAEMAKEQGVSVKTITRDAMKVDDLDSELKKSNLELVHQHREEIRRELLRLKELVLQSEQLDDFATTQAIVALNKQLIDLLGLDNVPNEGVPYNFECQVNFGPENCPHCGLPLIPPVLIPPAEVRALPDPIAHLLPPKPEPTVEDILREAEKL